MTRKHFIAIAALIKARVDALALPGIEPAYYPNGLLVDQLEDVANDLANYFIGENPNFDEARFLKACGF